HLLVILLFFYLSGHHTDLHSFPTRRSSDLSFTISSSKLVSGRGAKSIIVTFTPKREAIWANSIPMYPAPMKSILSGKDFKSKKSDRKSTRLNSSHVKISYAVFCLKKKKKKL